MELTNEQKKKGIWLEIKDLFTGAAFPVMLQLILSASIILFVDALSEDTALQIVVLVIGELLFMGAYTIFGRQNGITAYRRTVQHAKKRELQADDLTCWLKTGDYAVWKGIVIGLITVIPFMFVQFIHCVAPNLVCEFILKYAFGWAAYPFIVIGQAAGKRLPRRRSLSKDANENNFGEVQRYAPCPLQRRRNPPDRGQS